ncbi:hypothetical protein Daus18300_009000 [Diaporthe australafricana]|uniref:Uncharacterized protein n=1 Tax=Diaporthe australafricana TaxID=127596 RepID=A0ABR3WG32_9PEZI
MDAADELLQTKLTRRPTPRKTTYLGPLPQQQQRHHHPSVPSRPGGRGRCHNNVQGMPMPTRPAPAPPPAVDENERRGRRGGDGHDGERHDDDESDIDQASRIWAKIRRCSGVSSLADRTNMSMVEEQSLAARRGIPKAGGKGRKGSGRWGFGNWWA